MSEARARNCLICEHHNFPGFVRLLLVAAGTAYHRDFMSHQLCDMRSMHMRPQMRQSAVSFGVRAGG
jgi:hypothetical protein